MEFNIPKCVHLPITNKKKPRLHSYSLFLPLFPSLQPPISWNKIRY
ncbi:hypothetical protein NP493_2577g00003 [Ridgeia piscesae]|uniref:Uncharacterized protein n=1 Tax=Ridgeia piscesae TaxID=27915 RepID=A0AAD9MUP5_RIDPI|nr:hypothetical protein NP493_2577g00003 [Ridgeia piscesae]